jgi:hypothetical protein
MLISVAQAILSWVKLLGKRAPNLAQDTHPFNGADTESSE